VKPGTLDANSLDVRRVAKWWCSKDWRRYVVCEGRAWRYNGQGWPSEIPAPEWGRIVAGAVEQGARALRIKQPKLTDELLDFFLRDAGFVCQALGVREDAPVSICCPACWDRRDAWGCGGRPPGVMPERRDSLAN
jgi:hypothetical protein